MNLRRIGPQSERNRRSLETEKEGAEEKGREARGLFARAWAFLCGLAAGQKGKIAMRSDWHKELQDLRQFAESKGKENWRPESLTEVVKVTKFTAKEVKVIYRAFKQSSQGGIQRALRLTLSPRRLGRQFSLPLLSANCLRSWSSLCQSLLIAIFPFWPAARPHRKAQALAKRPRASRPFSSAPSFSVSSDLRLRSLWARFGADSSSCTATCLAQRRRRRARKT